MPYSDNIGVAKHDELLELSDDDHTQYALLLGRTGGQTLNGGIDASNNLILRSTTNSTRGDVAVRNSRLTTGTNTFTVATGVNDCGISGDFEVDGNSDFDGTIDCSGAVNLTSTLQVGDEIGIGVAPSATDVITMTKTLSGTGSGFVGTITTTTSGAVGAGINVLNFTLTDQSTTSSTIRAVKLLVEFERATLPTTNNQVGCEATYGISAGTAIGSGTYNWSGFKAIASSAGVGDVTAGTFTLIDFESDDAPAQFGGATSFKHFSVKFNDDSLAVDNASHIMGTGEDVSITYDGTNWIFNILQATTAIVFNEDGLDTDFRVESDNNINMLFVNAGTDRVGINIASPTTTFTVNGGFSLKINTKTADYTMLTTDFGILGNPGAGVDITITLPPASTTGQIVFIKKINSDAADTVTIARAGSDTIEGATSIVLSTQYTSRTLQADGTSTWYIISTT